ncbi:sprT-like domain-containing protein Spartan [Diachasma alloeum]|uniref:sprT-like domain-containing protein Spartan n=1 Tax=Diachasma alloeum TaxID=454923 RepID=UPI00073824CA|nr:sprT-like domain-containing protein Spartan [Diachasma alloeum]
MSPVNRFDREWLDWADDPVGVTENAIFPDHINKENYQPRTLVDQTLEIVDPIPNIHTLFVQFNTKFFNNVLLPVEVKWSPRMTSCAGVCTFRSRNRQCVISLSAPLLKLRPRKDLVETLLHEMIHAYLFLTNNNRDRDGHGPEFCKHMNRINAEAGTSITIYHDFHEEVKLYQQHWWKCNGPCSNRGPYFGTVRRAMNRAPGPSDSWYEQHRRTCGGTFIKIREPEKSVSKDSKQTKKTDNNRTLDDWFSPPREQKPNIPRGFVKLGNTTNNVHGFGTGGPSSSSRNTGNSPSSGSSRLGNSANNVRGWGTSGPGGSSFNVSPKIPSQPRYKVSGVVGGGGNTGKSCLLDRFLTPSKIKSDVIDLGTPEPKRPRVEGRNLQQCPVCQNHFPEESMNAHLDECLESGNAAVGVDQPQDVVGNNGGKVECPICFAVVPVVGLEEHVDACISGQSTEGKGADRFRTVENANSLGFAAVDSPPRTTKQDHKCLICGVLIPPQMSLEAHLDNCVKIRYGDDSDDDSLLVTPKTPRAEEYPCPVCMEMYPEDVMNDHLNLCI